MSSRVVWLHENQDIAGGLRRLAERIERGEIQAGDLTVAINADQFELYQFGSAGERNAARDAVFNLQFGLHWLARQTFDAMEDQRLGIVSDDAPSEPQPVGRVVPMPLPRPDLLNAAELRALAETFAQQRDDDA